MPFSDYSSNAKPTKEQNIRGLSNEDLLKYAGVAFYKAPGTDIPVLEGLSTKFGAELSRRGLSESDVTVPSSIADVRNLLTGFSSNVGKNLTGLLERFSSSEETARLVQQEDERQRAIANMEQMLADFQADPTFDNLLEKVRTLPSSFPEDLQKYMRNAVATQVRTQETDRLRRLRAARGIAGRAGASGAEAFLAEQAAAEADTAIAGAFQDIRTQAAASQYQDYLTQLGLEESLYSKKLATEQSLKSAIIAARQGLPYQDVSAPLQGYSAFLQALDARRVAEELAREQGAANPGASALAGGIKGASAGATLGPYGAVIGGVVGAAGGYYTAQNQG